MLTFCTLNYTHYGVFALSDFSEGSFAAAMGAMMRVDTDSDKPYLSVPADARAKIYAAVPELEPLAYWLEEDDQLQNDFRDPDLDDYRAGSFYWAIRRAAQFEGVYADAQTAAAYWQTVADKINAACDAGQLPSRTGKRTATSQPIKAEYVPATLSETWNGLCHAAGLRGCAPYEALRSIGTEEDFAAWSGYLHCSFNSAAEAGKDTPYYSRYQKAVFAVMQGWAWVYSILLTVGAVCALFFHLTELLPWIRKKCTAQTVVSWLLLFGIFGMALLRCAMIAFCRGVQLRHRHQYDVPCHGTPAAGSVRICRLFFVRQAAEKKGNCMTDLLVIGGGAAGLMAAGAACARGLTVTVLEHNPKGPGQKLLITGKGRCNLTSDSDVREVFTLCAAQRAVPLFQPLRIPAVCGDGAV